MITKEKALVSIILSTLLISGGAWGAWWLYRYVELQQKNDAQYILEWIVARSKGRESLPTVYIAEWLGLSHDKPTQLYRLSMRKVKERLLASPLLVEAQAKRLPPHTLYIQYTLRQPVAYWGDFTNTAWDTEGVPIPFRPFFTPKRLPTIYLGPVVGSVEWGVPYDSPFIAEALALLKEWQVRLKGHSTYLQRLDLSRLHVTSRGKQEIVLTFEEGESWTILRVHPDHPEEAWNDYLKVKGLAEAKYIDARIPGSVFLGE